MSVEELREAVGKLIADRASANKPHEIDELRTALDHVNKEIEDITNTINTVLNPVEPINPSAQSEQTLQSVPGGTGSVEFIPS